MPRHKLDRPNYRLRTRGRYWVIDWTDELTGRSRSVSTRQTERRAAEIWRDQWIAGREQPAPPLQPRITEIVEAYKTARRAHVAAFETLRISVQHIIRHVGNLEPRMLARGAYAARRSEDGVADGTVRREVTVARAALAWAVREGWIATAPYVEMPPRPLPRERWLTREEIDALIRGASTPHIRLFIVLGYHTAARAGAILDLTWGQVDLDRRVIDYQRPGRQRSRKRRAVVPLNVVALAELQSARLVATCDHVIEFRAQPVKSIKTGFETACQRAGIIDCTPNVLRHTAATHMVMARVPMTEIARMLGDTVAMIEQVYGKHSPDFLRSAAAALAGDVSPTMTDFDGDTLDKQGLLKPKGGDIKGL